MATAAIEGIKILSQAIFHLQRQADLSQEQVDQIFEESRKEVVERPGEDLTDV